jgi:hypothetical protein
MLLRVFIVVAVCQMHEEMLKQLIKIGVIRSPERKKLQRATERLDKSKEPKDDHHKCQP